MEKLHDWVGAVKRLSLSESLIFLAFILIPVVPLLGSPLLPRLGVWYQSEPLVAGVFGLASLCAMGLVVAVLTEPKSRQTDVMVAGYHPVVLLPIFIFVWSMLTMPFVPSPILSFYGAPQTGIGGAWFLAAAALTGGFRYLLHSDTGKTLKLGLAIYVIIAAVIVTMTGTGVFYGWQPFYYRDYLAFIGVFTWLAVAGIAPGRAFLQGVGILVGAGIIILSENRAAYGALALMPLVYIAAVWIRNNSTIQRRLVIAFIPVIFIITISAVVAFLRYSFLWSAFPEFIRNTILSRSLMLDVIYKAAIEDPFRLVVGEGWGMFSQTLLAQLSKTKTSLFHYSQDIDTGMWRWDALWRSDFDSHNFLAESILSGGLVAGLLILIWIGSAVAFSKVKVLPASAAGFSAFALTAGFWFQMPLSVPFMALAFASVSGRAAGRSSLPSGRKNQVTLAVIVSFLILSTATVDSLRFAVDTSRVVDANFTAPDPNSPSVIETFADDKSRGHYHFAETMRNYVEHVESTLKSKASIAPWRINRLEQFMAEADQRVENNAPIQVAIRALNTRSDLVFLERYIELGLPFKTRLKNWGTLLDRVLVRYPNREDLALAYHLWLLKEGREEELIKRSEKLLARNDQSPIGLWFSGVVLIGDPDRAILGMSRMRLALDNDIERLMPVDAALKKSIMEFQP